MAQNVASRPRSCNRFEIAAARWRASPGGTHQNGIAGPITMIRVCSELWALIAKMPKGCGASVEIIFADSQSLHEIVEIPEGDAERPLSTTSLESSSKNSLFPLLALLRQSRSCRW